MKKVFWEFPLGMLISLAETFPSISPSFMLLQTFLLLFPSPSLGRMYQKVYEEMITHGENHFVWLEFRKKLTKRVVNKVMHYLPI